MSETEIKQITEENQKIGAFASIFCLLRIFCPS